MLNHCTRGVHAQYTLCNSTRTVRVQNGLNVHYPCWPCETTVNEAQAQYTLCNGTATVRVKRRANRYTARAGHTKPLYKGYTRSTHCAIVHAQYEYKKNGLNVHYPCWPCQTTVQEVQAQYTRTLPVLTMPNHCTSGTSTVHTVRRYKYSTSTNAGK